MTTRISASGKWEDSLSALILVIVLAAFCYLKPKMIVNVKGSQPNSYILWRVLEPTGSY